MFRRIQSLLDEHKLMFDSRIPQELLKSCLVRREVNANSAAWPYDMEGHARKCVERYSELANKSIDQLCEVSTLCIDDHQFEPEELEAGGRSVTSLLVLWSVNKLERAVTKCTRACDKRLALSISDMQYTRNFRQCCHVGNAHCGVIFKILKRPWRSSCAFSGVQFSYQ